MPNLIQHCSARFITTFLCLALALSSCGKGTATAGANAPVGWTDQIVRDHNVTVRQMSSPGDPATASLLMSYEFSIPTVIVDLDHLAKSMLAPLKLTVTAEKSAELVPDVTYREFSATQNGGPVHDVAVIALEKADIQHVMIFAALPDEYQKLGGVDFMLKRLSDYSSFDDLTKAKVARRAAIGPASDDVLAVNKAGIELTSKSFGQLILFMEYLVGARLNAKQIETYKKAQIREWQEDDTPTDQSGELDKVLAQIKSISAYKKLQVIEGGYAQLWLDEKKKGETSVFLETALKLNPIHVEKDDLVLTDRAIQARLNSLEIYLMWSGKSKKEIAALLAKARDRMPREFVKMKELNRGYLANALSRGYIVWAWSANYSPEQKRKALVGAQMWSNRSKDPVYIGDGFEYDVVFKAQQTKMLEGMGTLMILPDLQHARPN